MAPFRFCTLVALLCSTTHRVNGQSLLITGIIEGSSNNKAIELTAVGGDIPDLSIFSVRLYSNGNSNLSGPTSSYQFPSQPLSECDTYVLVNSQADQPFSAEADDTSGVAGFNGNDALIVASSTDPTNIFDSFIQLGNAGSVNENISVCRLATTTSCDTTPDDAFTLSSEYKTFAQNTLLATMADDSECFSNQCNTATPPTCPVPEGPTVGVPKLISEVQGDGSDSPLAGETVIVTAVVTGVFQDDNVIDGDLNGYFIQEEDVDADGDPETSEGIFVQDGSSTPVNVAPGDLVEVTGIVEENFGQTQIVQSSITVVSTGNPLPSPAIITAQPGVGFGDLEPYEGMRVTFTDPLVLTESFNLDRFAEVRLFVNQRPYQYTQIYKPNADGFAAYQEWIEANSITYDDGFSVQNRYIGDREGWTGFADATAPRHGDAIIGATGVLGYSFGVYRILPIGADNVENTFTSLNPRPLEPPQVGGTLKLASVNVLNFFVTLDEGGNTAGPSNLEPRGADSTEEFERQVSKLVTYLLGLDADVLALAELENNFPDVLAALVGYLNVAAGATVYDYVDPGVPFVDTGDAISVGFIYKPSKVTLIGTPAILTDASVDPSLLSKLPIFDGVSTNRAPLAATFAMVNDEEEDNRRRLNGHVGECITVVAAHLKSKGPDGSDGTVNEDKNDGAGAYNTRRLSGAQAIDLWLQTEPTGVTCPYKSIAGDLNSYALEDPIVYLNEAGYRNVEQPTEYSYVFDGQWGTLDYILLNGPLYSRLTGAGVWHINADEVDYLDYNLDFNKADFVFDGTTPSRASDHSPVLVGLDMTDGAGTVTCGGKGKGGRASRKLARQGLAGRRLASTDKQRILREGKGSKYDPIDLEDCSKTDFYPGFEYDCIGPMGAGTAIADLRKNLVGEVSGSAYCCKEDCKEYTKYCFAAPYTVVGDSSPCDYKNVDAAATTPSYTALPLPFTELAGFCNVLNRPEDMEYDGPLLDVATGYDDFCRLDLYCCVPP
eukprot:scaffold7213_cov166-Amphora_coffeaeformis.AAC.20